MPGENTVVVANSTNAALIVVDAFDTSSTPTGKQLYDLPLAVRQASTGATIPGGASASVTLDAARSIYDLIFARPADLFPIQNSALMQELLSGDYPPLSVDAASPAQMVLALQFHINLLAYPTSNTAVQYQQAVVKAAQNGTSAESIEAAVNAYFQSTANYKTLTLNAVAAAQSYARSFAYLWAGFPDSFASFNDTVTYYLYSAGTSSSNSNQAPPTFQGSLTLKKRVSPPSPADPADRSGGYQITYTDPGGQTTNMLFADGQFVSDASDFPAIALQGTFVLKSTLTNQASDNQIIPLLSGVVNGVQVISSMTKQDSTADKKGLIWAFFHPSTVGEWIGLIATILGVCMGIEWAVVKARGLGRFFSNRGAPAEPSEIDQLRSQMNDLAEEARANNQRILDRLGNREARVPAEADLPAAQQELRANQVDAANVARLDAQLDVAVEQAAQTRTVAEYGVNPELAQAAAEVRANAEVLHEAVKPDAPRGDALAKTVDGAAAKSIDIQSNIDSAVKSASSSLSSSEAAGIEQSKASVSEAREVDEQAREAADDAGSGEGGDGDEVIEAAET